MTKETCTNCGWKEYLHGAEEGEIDGKIICKKFKPQNGAKDNLDSPNMDIQRELDRAKGTQNHSPSMVQKDTPFRVPSNNTNGTIDSEGDKTLSDKIVPIQLKDTKGVMKMEDVKNFIKEYDKMLIKKHIEEKKVHKNHRVMALLTELRVILYKRAGKNLI